MVHPSLWEKDASEASKLQISGKQADVCSCEKARQTNSTLLSLRLLRASGVRIVGAQPFAAFQSAIDNLLKLAPQMAANGKGN